MHKVSPLMASKDFIFMRRGPGDYFIGVHSEAIRPGTKIEVHGINIRMSGREVAEKLKAAGLNGMTRDDFFSMAKAYEVGPEQFPQPLQDKDLRPKRRCCNCRNQAY
jgi:hypothetical protein